MTEESQAKTVLTVDATYRIDVLDNDDVRISEYNRFYLKQAEIVIKAAAFRTLIEFYNRYTRE